MHLLDPSQVHLSGANTCHCWDSLSERTCQHLRLLRSISWGLRTFVQLFINAHTLKKKCSLETWSQIALGGHFNLCMDLITFLNAWWPVFLSIIHFIDYLRCTKNWKKSVLWKFEFSAHEPLNSTIVLAAQHFQMSTVAVEFCFN